MKRIFCACSIAALCLLRLSGQGRGLGVDAARAEPQIILEKDQVCNVYSIAFSPDGKLIAAGYNNDDIRLWSAETGSLVRTLSGHTGIVWSVAFSPDGKTLASGSADKTVKCWDVESGKELRTLAGHSNTVSFVVFSADGEYIASGSADKTIKFWDTANGRLLQTLSGHSRTIASIAYSRNGKYMASGSWDKTIKIYYAVGGAEIRTLVGHGDSVFAVAFSPDGRYLASGSADRTIRIWDASTGETVRTIGGYSDAVWSIAYSPDGRRLAGSAADGTVKVWDAESGKALLTLKGHVSPVRSVNYSADGRYIASGDSGGSVKIWSASSGSCLATILQNNGGEWVTWTPEGFFLGSPWALENLSYTVGARRYSIGQVYDKLYRPDLVAATIAGEAIPKAAQAASIAAIARNGTAPDVSFAIRREKPDSRDADLEIRVTNAGGGIGRVLLKLNERAILVSEGADCAPGQSISMEYPVTLRNGENTIALSAYDAAGAQEGIAATQKAAWTGETRKPRLFILAAAIDDYADPSIGKLKNCRADAKGLISSFSKYGGDIYTDVYARELLDSEVTREGLEKAFEDIGKEVEPDDVFIFYLAGHGKTCDDGDYYFIPCDFQYSGEDSILKGAISKWQLVKGISNIRAGHMLLLLDTCNAGSFVANSVERKSLAKAEKQAIIDRFAAKVGYDTVAACSTSQYAMDDFEGHGIFTYHVMEALQGFADLNRDGRITSTELSYYLITEVPISAEKRWGYRQEPQRILPTLDFVVAGRENPLEAQSLKKELAAAPASPPPAAEPVPAEPPPEHPGERLTAVLSFDDYGIGLAPECDAAELLKLDPEEGGAVRYHLTCDGAVDLRFSSPYAKQVDIAPVRPAPLDGSLQRLELPKGGRIALPWVPSDEVYIGETKRLKLENQAEEGFRSAELPPGRYILTVGQEYRGAVTIVSGADTEPEDYRSATLEGLEGRRAAVADTLHKRQVLRRIAWAGLALEVVGVTWTALANSNCNQLLDDYEGACSASSASAIWSEFETNKHSMMYGMGLSGFCLMITPYSFIKSADQRVFQDSLDAIDAGIRRLQK